MLGKAQVGLSFCGPEQVWLCWALGWFASVPVPFDGISHHPSNPTPPPKKKSRI